jgi:hypothetical protein
MIEQIAPSVFCHCCVCQGKHCLVNHPGHYHDDPDYHGDCLRTLEAVLPEARFHQGRVGSTHGTGLFASRDFKYNDNVLMVTFSGQPQPFNYINHSCDPNCGLHKLVIYARKDIRCGEELTIDYRAIRFPVDYMEFDCLCQSDICIGHVSAGWRR